MKITKENGWGDCFYMSRCWVHMKCAPSLGTKVVEVPQFWRENGKKYKVTSFSPEFNRDNNSKIILRVHRDCEIVGLFWNKYYTAERYD